MGRSLNVGGTTTYQVTPEEAEDIISQGQALVERGKKAKKKKREYGSINAQLNRIQELPTPLRILASPTTTAVLGGTLATISTGGGAGVVLGNIGRTALTTGGVALATGVLRESPTLSGAVENRLLHPVATGESLGRFIENPISTIKNLIKENPITSAVVGAGLVAGGVALYNYLKSDTPDGVLDTGDSVLPVSGTGGALDTPLSPPMRETTKIKPYRKRQKQAKAQNPMQVNQRVNVIVSNRSSSVGIRNTRYLKEVALLN